MIKIKFNKEIVIWILMILFSLFLSIFLLHSYGDPVKTSVITRSGRFVHYDHKGVGEYVRHYLKKDDIVIATHMFFQHIYAGKVDYWLWTGGPGTWDVWEKTPEGWKDVYIVARWINNLKNLKRVIEENPDKRIWIITSPSILRKDHINKAISDFIFGKIVYQIDTSRGSALFLNEKCGRKIIYYKPKKIFSPGHYNLVLRLKTDEDI